jgi:selenocysteine-specific elongation factor
LDRAFTVKGFGTVVTGTLVSGSVSKEQEVELYPSGRRLRVRGVQVYGEPATQALAGQRTALNLADIEPADLARGMVLASPGTFRTVTQVDCALDLLPSAKPLKHRAPVHFHAGTAEIEAQVRLLESTAPLQPGQRAWARIVLREPALLLPGDRFIIRMFSPVVTIGGGVVADTGARRYRKTDRIAERLRTLAEAPVAERIALLVGESKYGMGLPDLIARTDLSARQIAAASDRGGEASILYFAQPQPWFVDRAWFRSAREKLLRVLREFHQKNPLLPGIPKQDLRGRELPDSPPFLIDAILGQEKQIAVEGENVRVASHKLVLQQDEEQARAAIERAFEQAGLAVPALPDVLAKSGVEAARARSLLQILLREKRLIRISDDLVFHRSAMETLKAMLATHKAAHFNVGAFKDWTGISRKYAIPLLEYLDRERVTRREGDERIVL